jgi:hypothetical protein
VYGRPAGETAAEAGAFKEMVKEEMEGRREMWKVQLPFTAKNNEDFAEEALKEAVEIPKKADPTSGR